MLTCLNSRAWRGHVLYKGTKRHTSNCQLLSSVISTGPNPSSCQKTPSTAFHRFVLRQRSAGDQQLNTSAWNKLMRMIYIPPNGDIMWTSASSGTAPIITSKQNLYKQEWAEFPLGYCPSVFVGLRLGSSSVDPTRLNPVLHFSSFSRLSSTRSLVSPGYDVIRKPHSLTSGLICPAVHQAGEPGLTQPVLPQQVPCSTLAGPPSLRTYSCSTTATSCHPVTQLPVACSLILHRHVWRCYLCCSLLAPPQSLQIGASFFKIQTRTLSALHACHTPELPSPPLTNPLTIPALSKRLHHFLHSHIRLHPPSSWSLCPAPHAPFLPPGCVSPPLVHHLVSDPPSPQISHTISFQPSSHSHHRLFQVAFTSITPWCMFSMP